MKRWQKKVSTRPLRLFLICALLMLIGLRHCLSAPLNNPFDTQPIYNVFGSDLYYKDYKPNESFFLRFHLSPFYQSTSTARNNDGVKVPLGDRLGQWNLFGLFFGSKAAPKPFDFTDSFANNDPLFNLKNARKVISTQIVMPASMNDRYQQGSGQNPVDYTLEAQFNPAYQPFVFVSQPVEYEKIGLRSQLNFDFWFGLGFAIKAGVVDIKNSPSPIVREAILEADATLAQRPAGSLPFGPDDDVAAKVLVTSLISQTALTLVAQDLSLNLCSYHKAAAEDILIEMYWHMPFNFHDRAGDVALRLIPRIVAGVWLPTGTERDQDKVFSVPTGNDGFFAFVAEASLGFDFPIIPKTAQTLQFVLGGGATVAFERTLKQQRFPSSMNQSGLIPWKTDLSKRPGVTWYFNAAMKAEEFVDGLSLYCDYVYTQHLRDSVTIIQSDVTRLAAFQQGKDRFVKESSWRNQQVNVGFNYRVAENLALGGAVQTHISGTRVYRAVTLLGGLTFTF